MRSLKGILKLEPDFKVNDNVAVLTYSQSDILFSSFSVGWNHLSEIWNEYEKETKNENWEQIFSASVIFYSLL